MITVIDQNHKIIDFIDFLILWRIFLTDFIFRAPVRLKGDKQPLSVENSAKIIALSKIGLSCRKISDQMKIDFDVAVTFQTVQNIINREKNVGLITRNRNPGSGRQKKTSPRTDRVLKRLALSTRKQSFRQLAKSMEETTGIRLSINTIRNRLKEYDIRSYPCARKPLISHANRKKRRNWATKYGVENMDFWESILWSDESRFNLVSDRPQRCLRMPHERLSPKCLQSTVKFGGGGLMVWGVFSYNGIGELHLVNGNVNTAHYIRILNKNLFKSIEKLHPDGQYIFQQDNAPCHVSKKNQKLVRSTEFECDDRLAASIARHESDRTYLGFYRKENSK